MVYLELGAEAGRFDIPKLGRRQLTRARDFNEQSGNIRSPAGTKGFDIHSSGLVCQSTVVRLMVSYDQGSQN